MASIKPKYSNRFTKGERLSSKKWIEELFAGGTAVKVAPLKVLYKINADLKNPQILISIPKRNFKKASARNLLKRRVREAYRLNKHILNLEDGNNPMIAYIYLDTVELPYIEIEQALRTILEKIDRDIKAK